MRKSKQDDPLQLLDEITAMLDSPAEEVDVAEIEKRLVALQKQAPTPQRCDPQQQWERLVDAHPEVLEASPRRRPVFRVAVAVLAAALCAVVTVSALELHPLQAVLDWVNGVVLVTTPSRTMELSSAASGEYCSLAEALEVNGLDSGSLPTWIPEDYSIESASSAVHIGMTKYTALYTSERGNLTITVTRYASEDQISALEMSDADELCTINGTEYLIVTDQDIVKAVWQTATDLYRISGSITKDELTEMLYSIR